MKLMIIITASLMSIGSYAKTIEYKFSGVTPGPGKVTFYALAESTRKYLPSCSWRDEERRNAKTKSDTITVESSFRDGKYRFDGLFKMKTGKCNYKLQHISVSFKNPNSENKYTLNLVQGKKPKIKSFDLSTGTFDFDRDFNFYYDRFVQNLKKDRYVVVDFSSIGKTFRDKLNYFINHRDEDQATRLIQILSLNDLNKESRHYAFDNIELAHLIVLNQNADLLVELFKTGYKLKNNRALTHAIFYAQESMANSIPGLKLTDKMFNLLIQNSPDINAAGGLKKTPLHYALESGDARMVKLILDHPNVDYQKVDAYGKRPKDYAVARAKKNNDFQQFVELFD